jgi:LacI family transcriptional regulator
MARKRRQNKPKRIAIAIELDQPYPHHYDCCRGIQRYADERGDWQTVIDPYMVGMTGRAGVDEYDGVVGRITRQAAEAARARGIPVVNHWLNSPAKDLPCVFADFREGGRIAGEHLLGRGFRNFGYLGFARDRVGSLELAGFEQVTRSQGLDPPAMLKVSVNFEAGAKAFGRFRGQVRQWLTGLTPPVGIFATGAAMACYVTQICRESGIRVPLDVGIVTQYNTNIGFEPTFSSVDHDLEKIGYCAAMLLDRLMGSRRSQPKKPLLIKPSGLTVRSSSDAFVVADPLVAKALRFIADHARDAVTVEDVARHLHTTRRTLARRFKEFLGRAASDEINRLRLEYIKRRLEDPTTLLGVLATECGFHSPSHFALFFRKMTGIRPKDYRNGIANK